MCKQFCVFTKSEDQKKAIKKQAADLGIPMTHLLDRWLAVDMSEGDNSRNRDNDLVDICCIALKADPKCAEQVSRLLKK